MACGIATENYEKALEISLAQLEAIERGEISEEEFDASLKTIINQNRMLEDNYPALVGSDFVWRLHGGELDLDGLRERLAKVGRDDISAVAAALRHDTTYFLHS
jgi:predicted Zn-dependent peptidase